MSLVKTSALLITILFISQFSAQNKRWPIPEIKSVFSLDLNLTITMRDIEEWNGHVHSYSGLAKYQFDRIAQPIAQKIAWLYPSVQDKSLVENVYKLMVSLLVFNEQVDYDWKWESFKTTLDKCHKFGQELRTLVREAVDKKSGAKNLVVRHSINRFLFHTLQAILSQRQLLPVLKVIDVLDNYTRRCDFLLKEVQFCYGHHCEDAHSSKRTDEPDQIKSVNRHFKTDNFMKKKLLYEQGLLDILLIDYVYNQASKSDDKYEGKWMDLIEQAAHLINIANDLAMFEPEYNKVGQKFSLMFNIVVRDVILDEDKHDVNKAMDKTVGYYKEIEGKTKKWIDEWKPEGDPVEAKKQEQFVKHIQSMIAGSLAAIYQVVKQDKTPNYQ